MKRIYICAPFGSDSTDNIKRANQYSKYVFSFGFTPIAPQIYSKALDVSRPSDLKLGMEAGRNKLWSADELWVFGENITPDMRYEIRIFEAINGMHSKVRYISDAQLRQILKYPDKNYRR